MSKSRVARLKTKPRAKPKTRRPPRTLATGGGNAPALGVNFQQSLAALFGVWMLRETPADQRLQLGAAKITAIRVETEAPLDDVLAITSEGGVIAAQAKTKLSLSESLASEFGKTVDQIVRQWRLCRVGTGDLGWNRPLDQTNDRFLIAVGPDSPATIRVSLAKGLEARRQPCKPVLTVQQTKALKQFDDCVRKAWSAAANEPLTDEIMKSISNLTFVYPLDPEGADRAAWEGALVPALVSPDDASTVFNLLERVAGDRMGGRGGHNLATLRIDLIGRGARLAARPNYRDDIATLTAYSLQTERTLEGLEVVEAEAGTPVGITRHFQASVNAAALTGNLLLTGEPGAGKSAVINALGRALRAQGHDVVQMAVDRFSVESLEGLSRALGLRHELPAVLGAWDGPGRAFLLIDALDASRGGSGEAAFKRLIGSVIDLAGRWIVVASIRTFDLRLGQSFRALFMGTPPDRALQGEGFGNVRHAQIPPWSKEEFDELLAGAPRLAEVLKNTTTKLSELAMVPFNTRLLADLVATGAVGHDFNDIDSQIALLNLYWDWRVERHGVAAEVCLHTVVKEMVPNRALRAHRVKVAATNPAMLEMLTREGVLVVTNGERSVQFRHHLLFDYVVSRVFLDADGIVDGATTFPKAEGLGLVIAPAMGFLLQTLWSENPDHNRFWTAISNLLGASDCDPVIRSVAARIAAELPVNAEDIDAFACAINVGAPRANIALPHVAGAVAVRLEDHPETTLAPWVNLTFQLSARPADVAGVLRMMGFMLVERVRDPLLRSDLGIAVRALLSYGYGMDDSRSLATQAIGFVADTITTDANGSVVLLRKVLTDDRFDRFASEELPALARKINALAAASPGFAAEVYEFAFTKEVTDDRQTSMGSSRILNLTSNARQDFEHARWLLKEYFPRFLAASPEEATQALLEATAGYVGRQHPISSGLTIQTFSVQNGDVNLQPDRSHIWAHEAHPQYARDADALLSQFESWLEIGDETAILAAATYAARRATFAVVWSRLFMAAAARGGALADLLCPYAMRPEFLITVDTRKDAIDLLAAHYNELPEAERRTLESGLIAHPFDDFAHPDRARERFLRRLFGAIGADALATEAARAVLATSPEGDTSNNRLFTISTDWTEGEDYDWLNHESKADPIVRSTIDDLEVARQVLHLEGNDKEPILSLDSALAALAALKTRLDSRTIPDQTLFYRAEGTFAQGVHKVVGSEHIKADTPTETVAQLVDWIESAGWFSNPEVEEDTEAQFERGPSWSSPSGRLEAAEAALDLCLKLPTTYPSLTLLIDRMLVDPHPAVRMNTAMRLVRIWNIDRKGFWERAKRVIANERNPQVLDFFITKTMGGLVWHCAAREVADLILPLVGQYPASESRSADIREHLVQMTLQFWIRFGFEDAAQRVRAWFASAVDNVKEVRDAISWLRSDYTAGLRSADDPDHASRRTIAITLIAQAVAQASEVVTYYYTLTAPSEADLARVRDAIQIIDTACQELYFSSGAFQHGDERGETPMTADGAVTFLHEIAPVLRQIGEHGGPHTVYYLIQLLEHLVPADPSIVFDLVVCAVLQGGRRSGYQFESLAADLMVKLVGRYLADHKEVFEDAGRRLCLCDILETFVVAGWPSVRRLLYRLPELLQ